VGLFTLGWKMAAWGLCMCIGPGTEACEWGFDFAYDFEKDIFQSRIRTCGGDVISVS
jgi:hypothetical protein